MLVFDRTQARPATVEFGVLCDFQHNHWQQESLPSKRASVPVLSAQPLKTPSSIRESTPVWSRVSKWGSRQYRNDLHDAEAAGTV